MFWVRAFWAKLSKKGNFGHPPKKKKLPDNWKAHFLVFLSFFSFVFLLSVFCFFVFLGGFKGHVRWPEGPPHLALNPPYFFLFLGGCFFSVCFFSFLCLLLIKKQFSTKIRHFLFILSVSLCFSWAFFGLPLVQSLFLCLCLCLSLSLSLFVFSLFLPSCLSFLLSFGSLFLSLSLFFCLLSINRKTTSKYSITK